MILQTPGSPIKGNIGRKAWMTAVTAIVVILTKPSGKVLNAQSAARRVTNFTGSKIEWRMPARMANYRK